MECPICGSKETKVIDSRPENDFTIRRRKRECLECGYKFSTTESLKQILKE